MVGHLWERYLQDNLNPDDAETQPVTTTPDTKSLLSPVRPMPSLEDVATNALIRGHAKSNLSMPESAASPIPETLIENDFEEEEGEEEEVDDDVIVDDVMVDVGEGYQDNETVQLLSDEEECAMSPQKVPPEPLPQPMENIYSRTYGGLYPLEPFPDDSQQQPAPMSETQESHKDLENALEVEYDKIEQEIQTHEQAKARVADEVQEQIVSDEETERNQQNASKGTFKDWSHILGCFYWVSFCHSTI